MYVDPFFLGILATLSAEALTLFLVGVIRSCIKSHKESKER